MNEHTPDSWVLIKISGIEGIEDKVFFKVLAGWSGGYLDGDSWRLNSGIDKIEDKGDYWAFIGASGSVYNCGKESNTMRMSMSGTWMQLKNKFPDNVELVEVDEVIQALNE